MSGNDEGGLVYSSQFGRMCPRCSQPIARCTCKSTSRPSGSRPLSSRGAPGGPTKAVVPNDGIVRVFRETKGRKGKGVTIIRGLALSEDLLESLAKELKKKCGAGGTCTDGAIEIQGDHRDALVEELARLGYKAKKAGG